MALPAAASPRYLVLAHIKWRDNLLVRSVSVWVSENFAATTHVLEAQEQRAAGHTRVDDGHQEGHVRLQSFVCNALT